MDDDEVTEIDQALRSRKEALLTQLSVAGLIARNETAHKWKTPFRSLLLRESVCWRLQDLLTQSWVLHRKRHGLGARILLRSAIETLAILIFLNQLTEQVLDGSLNFHEFGVKTTKLLTGSRKDDMAIKAVNILTILNKCNSRYPGIKLMYDDLSESAHPNYEGLCNGYSTFNHDEHETAFSNRWMEIHGDRHPDLIMLCIETFDDEYHDVWEDLFTRLEKWIEANDAELEATKPVD